jgi:hypothetical protein
MPPVSTFAALDPATPLCLTEAERRLRGRATSAGAARNLVAALRRTVAAVLRRDPEPDTNLWPLIPVLAWASTRTANPEDASRIALAVEAVTGWRPGKTQKGQSDLILKGQPGWAPYVAAAAALGRDRCWLADVARCELVAGNCDAPRTLSTREELETAAAQLGISQKRIQQAFVHWRAIRSHAVAADPTLDAPTIPVRHPTLARHLLAAPAARELLKAAGLDPDRVSPSEARAALAPRIEGALRALPKRLRDRADAQKTSVRKGGGATGGAPRRRGARRRSFVEAPTLEQVQQTAGVLLGAMARSGRPELLALLKTITPLDLWTHQVAVPTAVPLAPAELDEFDRACGVTEPTAPADDGTLFEEVPLILYLLQVDAPLSRAASPVGAKTGFTHAQLKDVHAARFLAEVIHFRELRGEDRLRFETRYTLVESTVRGGIATVADGEQLSLKDKRLALQAMTLPLVACVGLPILRRRVALLRRRWLHQRATAEAAVREGYRQLGLEAHKEVLRAEAEVHPAVARAYRRYARRLRDTLLVSLLFADGLRAKQYARGLMGRHFHLEISADSSRITRFASSWTGDAGDPARVKNHTKKEEVYKRPNEQVCGLLDLKQLAWFLTEVRAVTLRALGEPAPSDLAGIAAEDGRWALFPGKQPTRSSRAHLSREWVGRTLHWLAREVLRVYPGPGVVPDTDGNRHKFRLAGDDATRRRWRAIFAAHIARLLLGTHLVLVMKEPGVAARLTSDEVETLLTDYVNLEIVGSFPREDVRHPEAFDLWLRPAILDRRFVDPWGDPAWRALVAQLPGAAAAIAEIEAEERAEARRMKRRARLEIRRSRPAQVEAFTA